jgi:hypothetical protein
MKHLRIFENIKSVISIKDVIVKYMEIIEYIRPAVIDRYNEIASDPELDYGQNITDVYGGSSFYTIHNLKGIQLKEISFDDNKFFFTLEYFDSYSTTESPDIFYVPFTEEELEDAILKLNAKKYNI